MNKFFLLLILFLVNSTLQAETIKLPKINEAGLSRLEWFYTSTAKGLNEFIANKPELSEVTNVFYPFGGADIIYPLMIFPQANDIIIVGLENIGHNINFDNKEFIPLCDDVDSLLRRSFFVTMEMSKNFTTKNVGIKQRILEQLALLGIREVDIQISDPKEQKLVINFIYKGIPRSVSYFKKDFLNIQNTSTFLSNITIEGVLLKSTSYSLHRKEFSHIRDFIVTSAKIIVEDDSGIPLHTLKQSYIVEKYGKYTKPYGADFIYYKQNDLVKKESVINQPITFCFGYGCRKQPTALLIAKKIQEIASK